MEELQAFMTGMMIGVGFYVIIRIANYSFKKLDDYVKGEEDGWHP